MIVFGSKRSTRFYNWASQVEQAAAAGIFILFTMPIGFRHLVRSVADVLLVNLTYETIGFRLISALSPLRPLRSW